jgi:hypothetical protein
MLHASPHDAGLFAMGTFWELFAETVLFAILDVCKILNFDGNFGAGDGDRTRDVQLGKLAFYR